MGEEHATHLIRDGQPDPLAWNGRVRRDPALAGPAQQGMLDRLVILAVGDCDLAPQTLMAHADWIIGPSPMAGYDNG
jgi:hypothetical protein